MRIFNTYFSSFDALQEFVVQNGIVDIDSLLIQVFTGHKSAEFINTLRDFFAKNFPKSSLIGSTTDGEIKEGVVSTDKTVVSFTLFKYTKLQTYIQEDVKEYFQAGKEMATTLIQKDTKAIISFIDGLGGNGEEYLSGINSINKDIKVAGGLAGDNGEFVKTFVFTKETLTQNGVVAVALNSHKLHVHTHYNFGWLPIGKELTITKSLKNRVYTIDEKSAYDTYKHYLGENIAKKLPAIGVEFPLIVNRGNVTVARALISRGDDGSLLFAGNLNEGDIVRFGYGDIATILQKNTISKLANTRVEAVFIYSCMARRRFMQNEIEIETKRFNALAKNAGFFTYGEFFSDTNRELLNQTMTILALSKNNSLNNDTKRIKPDETIEHKNDTLKALSHLVNVTSKEIEEQKNSFEYLFNHTIEAIGVFEENRCVDVNDAALRLFKFTDKQDIIGKSPLEFIAPLSQELVAHYIKHRNTQAYEAFGVKQDGEIFPMLISAHNKKTEEKEQRIVFVLDITELKKKGKALTEETKKHNPQQKQRVSFWQI